MSDEWLLNELELPRTLRDRMRCHVAPLANKNDTASLSPSQHGFVLYLPTVVLRKRHNPAFGLACRLANHHQVPLIVLCTVLDDHHLQKSPPLKPICMTARRLAFTLQAYQSCAPVWQAHGAGVALRVHGPGARTPHPLTLTRRGAVAVVLDESFVAPYTHYAKSVVTAATAAGTPCWSVDGSTSVPPRAYWKGALAAPGKAWQWEKQTAPFRKAQVQSAMRGNFEAPELQVPLPDGFFLECTVSDESEDAVAAEAEEATAIMRDRCREIQEHALPKEWRNKETASPGTRPWTVQELLHVDIHDWVLQWPGTDPTVPPCLQTHGSQAVSRWKSFKEGGLKDYAKRRNQIVLPHAVSRISCFLNLGTLSIFDVLSDVWEQEASSAQGCRKFLDEVVKWREIGYVHAFATPDFGSAKSIPRWAHAYLQQQHQRQQHDGGYSFQELESATTRDDTWNAMQGYLMETGELHNNARMTWGKTVVHWQAQKIGPEQVLEQLVCLNDRFALDGLSPPSYAGILWCFGWCDKPAASGGGVSQKSAHAYRCGPQDFERAKQVLLSSSPPASSRPASSNTRLLQEWVTGTASGDLPAPKRARQATTESSAKKKTPPKTILSFFAPAKSKKGNSLESER